MTARQPDMELARRTLRCEGQAVAALAEAIDEHFAEAAGAVFACRGKVVLTGIGKAGLVAQKVSATLASTGTQSIFLHPVEALHGDLGRLGAADLVVALSHSGHTEEIIRLIDHVKARGAGLVAFTAADASPLARHADIAVCYGRVEEAEPLGLAPTVSTACMLALGDALALTVAGMRDFGPEDFAAFHPAGALGRRLMKVEDTMSFRRGEALRVARDDRTVRQALDEVEAAPRRAGAMLLVDGDGRLSGILTDADLRRALLRHADRDVLNDPVSEHMTADPLHVHPEELASEALAVFHEYRIDELPVVDADHRPVGMIDVQDLLGLKTVIHGES